MLKRHVYPQTIDLLGDWMTEKDLASWRDYLVEHLSDKLSEELPGGNSNAQIGRVRDESFDVFVFQGGGRRQRRRYHRCIAVRQSALRLARKVPSRWQ